MVTEKAYAKINLSLNILGKRNDGYHDIFSCMTSIGLYDLLEFELADDITIIGEFNISKEENIIYKAAMLLKDKTGYSGGCKITVDKNIPVEAGLAGGSSDCAATLRGLNRLWNLKLSRELLLEYSLLLGSDTAFCMEQRTAIVSGRGDKLDHIADNSQYKVLLIKPDFGVSTKFLFSQLNEYSDKSNEAEIIDALSSNDISKIKGIYHNSFEKLFFSEFKEAYDLRAEFLKLGYTLQLSGTGSAMYVIYNNEDISNLIDLIPEKFKYFLTENN